VDDVKSTLLTLTPATDLCCYVALAQSCDGPNVAGHGTGLPFAGMSSIGTAAAAQAVAADVRTTVLPGSPPRGAPV
jgi:hypothetical protein